MNTGKVIASAVVIGGGWYLLTKSGALQGTGAGLDDLGFVRHEPTPAEIARAQALRQPAPGNAPIPSAQSPSFVSSGGLVAIGGAASAILASTIAPGIVLGAATAGIGLAVTFLSYELMKQRASMHTNDVRDAWQKQFIAIHDALGLTPLRADQTAGSGPGNIEAAEVIFFFDHDPNNTLWKSFTKTQDERVFRAAAANVDAFLTAHGVPVQDVA